MYEKNYYKNYLASEASEKFFSVASTLIKCFLRPWGRVRSAAVFVALFVALTGIRLHIC